MFPRRGPKGRFSGSLRYNKAGRPRVEPPVSATQAHHVLLKKGCAADADLDKCVSNLDDRDPVGGGERTRANEVAKQDHQLLAVRGMLPEFSFGPAQAHY